MYSSLDRVFALGFMFGKGEKKIEAYKNRDVVKLVLVAIVISPILIAVFVSLPILDGLSASNDWIGFWGGYIGAILGGIITLYVLLETIRDNKEQQRRNERISFYNRLLEKNRIK